jgi:predicted metal-dependent hydrolase
VSITGKSIPPIIKGTATACIITVITETFTLEIGKKTYWLTAFTYSRTAIAMKVSSRMESKDGEDITMPTEMSMKAIGRTTWNKEGERWRILTAKSMTVCGSMAKEMAKEHITTKMEQYIKAISHTAIKRALDLSSFQIKREYKPIGLQTISKVRVRFTMQTAIIMKEIFIMAKSKA